jgi:hypothetical protein
MRVAIANNEMLPHPVGMGRSVEYRATTAHNARSRDKALQVPGTNYQLPFVTKNNGLVLGTWNLVVK